MFLRLAFLFIAIPLIELWLLLQISEFTSAGWTILLVIATGLIGAALARRQGFQTWQTIRQQLASGIPPTDALLNGLLILIAGAVLITPGILTDLFGFALLVPPLRAKLARRLARWVKERSTFRIRSTRRDSPQSADQMRDGTVIDAEFTKHPGEEENE